VLTASLAKRLLRCLYYTLTSSDQCLKYEFVKLKTTLTYTFGIFNRPSIKNVLFLHLLAASYPRIILRNSTNTPALIVLYYYNLNLSLNSVLYSIVIIIISLLSADWWEVLTAPNAVGTNGLTCLLKHGIVIHLLKIQCMSERKTTIVIINLQNNEEVFKRLIIK
jgi:hypothetical protein